MDIKAALLENKLYFNSKIIWKINLWSKNKYTLNKKQQKELALLVHGTCKKIDEVLTIASMYIIIIIISTITLQIY